MVGQKNMTFPKVAVQILFYNEPVEEADALMCSLEKMNYPREAWQIFILKSFHSESKIADFLKNKWLSKAGLTLPQITFLELPNTGFSGGHNRLFEASQTWEPDFLYLLNGDAAADPECLIKAVEIASDNPKAALVQSLVMLEDRQSVNSLGNAMHFLGFGFTLGHHQEIGKIKNTLPMFYASGAGLLVRTSVLKEIGGLFKPDYFLYHEDLDLSWRARLAGYDILLAPESKIFHHYEFSKSIKKFYFMERNRHLTNLVNYKWPTLFLMSPAALAMEFGTTLFSFRSGWWKEKWRSYFYFLRPATWVWIFCCRAEVRRFRVKRDREMLELMTGVIINQEVENLILAKIVNPILKIYFCLLKAVIFW
jgi:GT2 family glycosyltransferase